MQKDTPIAFANADLLSVLDSLTTPTTSSVGETLRGGMGKGQRNISMELMQNFVAIFPGQIPMRKIDGNHTKIRGKRLCLDGHQQSVQGAAKSYGER
jgi:hypothetical protein